MSLKRPHSPPSPKEITFSTKTTDSTGTSHFLAAFSPTLPAPALQRLPEFSTASHRIAAWRKPSRQRALTQAKTLYDTGHDDDGEKWAGSRLLNVLNDTLTEGTIVCARWYGGQNIGPVRFTHIEDCAKRAIWEWKSGVAEREKAEGVKKRKVEDEKRKRELIESLEERDANVVVLRGLLAEKKAVLSGEGDAMPRTPQKAPPDYGKLELEALGRLDKARDATIAFILKQIDKVDEELKAKGKEKEKEGEVKNAGEIKNGEWEEGVEAVLDFNE